MQKVSAKTQETYSEAWQSLVNEAGGDLTSAPPEALDRELDRVILARYLDGAPVSECRVMFYATRWRMGTTNLDLKRS